MRVATPILLVCMLAVPASGQSRRGGPAAVDPAIAAAFPSLDAAVAAAKSDDPQKQIAAARWMGATRAEAATAVPALVPLLDKGSLQHELSMHVIRENPATAAARAIQMMGPDAVAPLAAAANNPAAAVRANVVYLLGGRGDDPKAQEALLACLNDADAGVRTAAIRGLVRANTADATSAILPRLQDTDAHVRAAAAGTLGYTAIQRTTGKPIPSDLQATVVEKLAAMLKDPEKNVKINAAESLGHLRNGDATEALAAAVDDPDVRVIAVQALGNIGNSRGTPAVIHILKTATSDEDATARALAAQALGKLVDVRAVTPLIAALKDKDENVRQWAADSLGLIGDRRAIGPLVEVLKDKDIANQRVRSAAARSLGRIDDPRAIEPLIAALADKVTRHDAIRALGTIRDPAAIEPLAKVLFDEKATTQDQESSAWAISQIRDPQAIRALAEGALQAKKGSYAGLLARGTLEKLLDTKFSSDGQSLAAWWEQHKGEYEP